MPNTREVPTTAAANQNGRVLPKVVPCAGDVGYDKLLVRKLSLGYGPSCRIWLFRGYDPGL